MGAIIQWTKTTGGEPINLSMAAFVCFIIRQKSKEFVNKKNDIPVVYCY